MCVQCNGPLDSAKVYKNNIETYFDDIDTDKNMNRFVAGKTSEQS